VTENLDIAIGDKLRKLREQKGYSIREVGKRINISHTYVSKIEKGKIPSLNTLNKLCELYGITIPELFGGESVDVPKELQDEGVEWIIFTKEMKQKNYTPEKIKQILEVVQAFKDL
jgi:transcriptional regulator with XRE-family HTH domain